MYLRRPRVLATLLISTLLPACASRVVVVDTAEVDKARLKRDTTECHAYVEKLENDGRIAQGIFVGALFAGLAEYVFSGGDEDFARQAAFVGGLDGGLAAASEVRFEKNEIVKNCLARRGYRVLN